MLVVYDYILTVPLEVSEIWSSRFTAAKLFFLLNRYGIIAYFCLYCVLNTLQTQSILVRPFYSLSMDADYSSRRESSVWSTTFCYNHYLAVARS